MPVNPDPSGAPFTPTQVELIQKAAESVAAWYLELDDPEAMLLERLGRFQSAEAAAIAMATLARLVCELCAGITHRTGVQVLEEVLELVDAAQRSGKGR